ncbi:hypothetical protein DV515_00004428 [Chloebia gouldiae]|uniref:Uncharacterized protein n=1 Tax=Chloebia gouldiae TaxID=44316 RepID=A0A3L8SR04_CHLGU|nr:hypothetical protein DV515_00004428 [Chloebia gouldiae]
MSACRAHGARSRNGRWAGDSAAWTRVSGKWRKAGTGAAPAPGQEAPGCLNSPARPGARSGHPAGRARRRQRRLQHYITGLTY